MEPDGALAICRFAHDAAAMLLWGAFAFLWLLVPVDLATRLAGRFARFRVVATVTAVAATMAVLPLEAAAIGTGWQDALDPRIVRAVLFDTSVGHAWFAQAGAALLLAATLVVRPSRQKGSTAVASGVLLASVATTGHAAMHEGWLGLAHRLTDGVHVLAGGAWLGALVPLVPLLHDLETAAPGGEAAVALRRFSTAGHWAVAVVIATGVVNTTLVLGRWPTDWSSPYQALLAAKIALVALMTAFAVLNRYILVPEMTWSRAPAVHALCIVTVAEIGLALAVVGLVGVFGLLEPE